ncbi:MAG: hypothetical protein KKE30_05625 [Gammaproteobacteria bacterium]|nr:hypothetical protein [Gammaproteobacteria bacterium]MBU1554482.1 hypothetical protein [Gammaproteobacteria bacterium]MBU2070690.1 hypothetical protein [Gammaproteobacteria bacterium]MBU2184216.1 hypothetical protein [Gammaproteobacteria bacterium]MBU2206077.1 hypothetical protein [Gammaproteobacteria bacterium]
MIQELATVISIVVGIAGVVALVHRILLQSMVSGMKQFELFRQLQELCGSDARNNLAAIRVALTCFTKRELTTTEIELFLLVPGAFSFLRSYGKLRRYVTIDFNSNEFVFKPEFDSKRKQMIEWGKLVGLYLTSGTLGAMLVLAVPITLNTGKLNPWGSLHIAGYFLCLVAIFLLFMGMKLDDAKRLVKKKLP